ncbi:hypothetical protein F9C07_11556 [Aspergillus flavus]|uniref:Uncharacterized protein n=1 Tax=Aspergillus flavus (strain ATCC 200026 / FGSC A1120 / IAM 13836 / NRRL 3357 / JCM 12722 / SRRC 167) TaxID=332952 RepID=A0A7U2N383_ASPFN|nr:uncharacterized protein G4B84_009050 [Aspergillus flavus NRRL3357]KAF7622718.1 hypothetical protein AFLA_010039 [Aspergillus flavus NRRL3357]QMW33584.1 hypothetical protein G4B84_009050 [Aspergillus flavus NRRL3357]QRD94734.1 hypothetical protein F9C07_11556 [Aspergillus flavus]
MALVSLNLASLHRASGAEIISAKFSNTAYHYERARDKSEEPLIPDPQLFQSSSHSTSTDIPTISECAIHLELLEVFHALRDRVQQSTDLDNTFGIKPNIRTVYRKRYSSQLRKYESYTVTVKDTQFETRRKDKWHYFLELAVGRFTRWIRTVNMVSLSGANSQNENEPSRLGLLPPVDVLMVWHAFLLNPDDFDFYCVKHRLERMRKAPLPWQQIHEAINSRDWSYTLPEAHKNWLEKKAEFKPDLFETLVELGKRESHAKHVLSQYGSGSKTSSFSLLKYIDTPANYAFVEMVQATRASALRNKALKANVERQLKFVEKMHDHLWIRSPAVDGTLRRAIDRYEKFLQLFRDYPKTTLVPTLDVDLVWHTHLCNPEQYRTSLVERAGRMVNHDDKLGKSFLDIRFDKTQELFQIAFGQQYHVCLCWDCEAVSSAMEAFVANYDMDIIDDVDCDADNIVKKVEEDVRYYRAVEIARRKGVALPIR